MGWGEVRASVSHFRHVPIVLLSAALLGGCFQPLYGTGSEPGRPAVRDALSAIDIAQIDAAANTSEAPLAVQIRNDLLFNFTGGGYPAPPTHKLKVQINGNRAVVSIDVGKARDRWLNSARELAVLGRVFVAVNADPQASQASL